jgi:hypothetical protein
MTLANHAEKTRLEQVEQVEHPSTYYCTHKERSTYEVWIEETENLIESFEPEPVPPVPDSIPATPPIRGTFITAIGPPPPAFKIDALHSGRLTGRVPSSWTTTGWLISLKDRMNRTDDALQRDRFREEILAVSAGADGGNS